MKNLTSYEYYKECEELVSNTVAEVADDYMDADDIIEAVYECLYDVIDGHQWVIYSCYNLQILQISSNDNALISDQGDDVAAHVLRCSGIGGLHSALAHSAMVADCLEYVQDAVKDWLDANAQ